jgi:hypothetical protein
VVRVVPPVRQRMTFAIVPIRSRASGPASPDAWSCCRRIPIWRCAWTACCASATDEGAQRDRGEHAGQEDRVWYRNDRKSVLRNRDRPRRTALFGRRYFKVWHRLPFRSTC